MDEIFKANDWTKLHHAYLFSGVSDDEMWAALEQNLSFRKIANPDAFSRIYDVFGIDEAREVAEWAMMKPLVGDRKVAVVSTLSFTTEAQNALLKIFEEPPPGTHFFILVPSTGVVLPTLLSRMMVVDLPEKNEVHRKLDSFLEANISQRMNMLASLIKSKDKEKARNLITSLEQKVYRSPDGLKSAEKILKAKRYIGARGGSLKMILEYLAISI